MRPTLLHGLFFLSGFAALGYQIVWTGTFAVGLGHEVPSLLSVVAAFFGGLAIGALALDRVVSGSRTPGRWYAILEIAIGVWALVGVLALGWLNTRLAQLIGTDPAPARHWLLSFAIPFVALLPATAAMGATLPAIDRFLSRMAASGRQVGGLYAANTLGAMAGVVLTTFALAPALGFRVTTILLAALNIGCGVLVLLGPARGEAGRPDVPTPLRDVSPQYRLLITLFVTGLLGIGYEVLAVRVMGQVLQNTVFSFASALAVYLLFTAVGGAAYQAWAKRFGFDELLTYLLQALCLTCLLGVVVLGGAPTIYEGVRNAAGHDFVGSIVAEMTLAALAFALPSFVMGATFSHLTQGARGERKGVGAAVAVNTLGGAAAPLLFGVLLLPVLGARNAMAAAALGYLPLLPSLNVRRLVPLAAGVVLVPLLPGDLRHVEPLPNGSIVEYREGVLAAVAVVDDGAGDRVLKVNNHFAMGGLTRGFAERREAHIPLLLHRAPKRALFLGVGTGITVGAGTQHPDLEVHAVELVPEIVEMLDHFDAANERFREHPNVRLHVADARRHVRVVEGTFDVIVADLFHPARDGSGWLYTVEHFQAIRERLADGGLFCQWMPLHQMDLDVTRTVVRTYLHVFPHAIAFIAHLNAGTPILGLIGGDTPLAWKPGWSSERIHPLLRARLQSRQVALYDDFQLFTGFIADRAELARLAGAGPLNTDDRPIVRYRAPRLNYTDLHDAGSRLAAVIDAVTSDPATIFPGHADDAFVQRLRSALDARDVYLAAEIEFRRGAVRTALELYLQSAVTSRDFGAAYPACVLRARQAAPTEPEAARSVLRRLRDQRPDKPHAAAALKQLFDES